MLPGKPAPALRLGAADTSQAVDGFMAQLDHPFKAEIQVIRRLVLGADPSIAEGVKWQAPSFRTTAYFATTHLRHKTGVGLIFHRGAKVRPLGPEGLAVADPDGLLQWLAPDRAMVVFTGPQDISARQAALGRLVQQWIAQV